MTNVAETRIALVHNDPIEGERCLASILQHIESRSIPEDPLAPFFNGITLHFENGSRFVTTEERVHTVFPAAQHANLPRRDEIPRPATAPLQFHSDEDLEEILSSGDGQDDGTVRQGPLLDPTEAEIEDETAAQPDGTRDTKPARLELTVNLHVARDFQSKLTKRRAGSPSFRERVRQLWETLTGGDPEQPDQIRVVFGLFDLGQDLTDLTAELVDFVDGCDTFATVLLQSLIWQTLSSGRATDEIDDLNALIGVLGKVANSLPATSNLSSAEDAIPLVLALNHSLVPASFASEPSDLEEFMMQASVLKDEEYHEIIDDSRNLPISWLDPLQFIHDPEYIDAIHQQWQLFHSGFSAALDRAKQSSLSFRCVHFDMFGIDVLSRQVASLTIPRFSEGSSADDESNPIAVDIISTLFPPPDKFWLTHDDRLTDAIPPNTQRIQAWQPYRAGAILLAALASPAQEYASLHRALWVPHASGLATTTGN